MGNIAAMVKISEDREKAKEMTSRVQKKRELNQDNRPFGDILQEEIDKHNKKATKDTGK
jgi:hypothetical protein